MPKNQSNPAFEKHLKQPVHQGPLKNPTNYAELKSIENGKEAKIEVYCQTEKNLVRFIQFVSDASPQTIACLSFLCSELEGKPLNEIENWTSERIADEMGLSKKQVFASQNAFDAVWKALHGNDLLEEAFATIRKYNEYYPPGGQYKAED